MARIKAAMLIGLCVWPVLQFAQSRARSVQNSRVPLASLQRVIGATQLGGGGAPPS